MGYIKGYFVFVLLLIIAIFGFRIYLVVDAKKTDKPIYEIEVNNFNNYEVYLTKSFTKDEKTGCISFRDEFGVKHIVCNNYTITQY